MFNKENVQYRKYLIFFSPYFFYRENEHGWEVEIQDDVIEECNKHGGVIHIYVDKKSAEVRFT